MKTMKNLFSIMLVAFVLVATSCSKSGDPTPTTPTAQSNLDKVKATLTGTWSFQEFTLTEIANSKSKTITSCNKAALDNFYSNGNWVNLTPEFNFVYSGATSADGSNACVSATATYTISVVENADHTVNVTLDAGGTAKQVYNVNVNDITSTSIKGTLVSNGSNVASTLGYNVIFTYKRS
jgi:hypothetical protein